MLNPDDVDLADLALALEDHAEGHAWWFDRRSGAVAPREHGMLAPGGEDADVVAIQPLPVAVGYRDMEEFVEYVRDIRARDLLERAIVGRGAFRRFKDALTRFPELRGAWFAFHDARGERRAIEWLVAHQAIGPDDASEALRRRCDPEAGDLPGLLDAHGLAQRVAIDLRRIYRDRLQSVLLAGPWARGEAHPEAAVELIVVLDGACDPWVEKQRIESTVWRHCVRNDVVVTALPVAASDLEPGGHAAAGAGAVRGSAGPVSRDGRVLERGREEVRSAAALLAAGFPSQSLARAYVGALRAAEVALEAADTLPATPAGVVSAFNRRVVVQGGMDARHGRALRRLFDERHDVDHALAEAPVDVARSAIDDAEALIAATERWIAERRAPLDDLPAASGDAATSR